MRHIQDKNDWAYEFRPQILTVLGAVGIANFFNAFKSNSEYAILSVFCGLVLLAIAHKISNWRREYRKHLI